MVTYLDDILKSPYVSEVKVIGGCKRVVNFGWL